MTQRACDTNERASLFSADERAAAHRIELLLDLFGKPESIPQTIMLQAVSGSGLSLRFAYKYAEVALSDLQTSWH